MTADTNAIEDERLANIRWALTRLNIDWQRVRDDCGDPKCEGDCRYVAELENLLRVDLT